MESVEFHDYNRDKRLRSFPGATEECLSERILLFNLPRFYMQ